MLNRTHIIGILVDKPEITVIGGEKKLYTMLVDVPTINKETKDRFRISVFSGNMSNSKYVMAKKGNVVSVEGILISRTNKDKEGNTYINLDLMAERVLFLSNQATTAISYDTLGSAIFNVVGPFLRFEKESDDKGILYLEGNRYGAEQKLVTFELPLSVWGKSRVDACLALKLGDWISSSGNLHSIENPQHNRTYYNVYANSNTISSGEVHFPERINWSELSDLSR